MTSTNTVSTNTRTATTRNATTRTPTTPTTRTPTTLNTATLIQGSAEVAPSRPAGDGPVAACGSLAVVPSADGLDRLAHLVAADGIAAHEDAIGALLTAAVARGIDEVLIATTADTAIAPVMRERALGHLLSALA